MKIQEVHIKEFKILKDFDSQPNGSHMMIVGKNGKGKSTLIQFIKIALGYQDEIPLNSNGKGVVIVNKNGEEIELNVEVKDGKSIVTIKNGSMRDKTKGALVGLVGAIDFNIQNFVQLSKSKKGKKEQVEIFKSFLPDEVKKQLSKLESNVACNFEDRTAVNLEVKRLKGALESNPLFGKNLSDFKAVNVEDLSNEITTIRSKNDETKSVKDRIKEREDKVIERSEEIKELQLKLDRLKDANHLDEEKNKQAKEYLNQNPLIDLTEKEQQMVEAGNTNYKYNQAQSLLIQVDEFEKKEKEAGELTALIESSREEIKRFIREMNIGIDGLYFEEEELLLNGISIDQLSESETMELGVKIKMLENPELGIIFLEQCESLDNDKKKLIIDMCNAKDWQFIGEEVQSETEKLTVKLIGN